MKDLDLLRILKERKNVSVRELASELALKFEEIARAAYSLSKKGLVRIEKKLSKRFVLTELGKKVLREGAPERKIVEKAPIEVEKLSDEEKKVLGFAIKRGWVKVEKGTVVKLRDASETEEERALRNLEKAGDELIKRLKRRGWIKEEEEVDYLVEVTEKGLGFEEGREITQITPEILVSGAWKNARFRRFSVKEPGKEVLPARLHPVTEIIEKIRRIFLNMGFTEAFGPLVELAFWNFDALFVPQDHPAREMQDTFYLSMKAEELPKIVDRVEETHRRIWGSFDKSKSKQMLLRTHTTSVSARMLAQLEPPAKIFSIDKVFRNETVDYKHLAEFHQVEGIVYAENVTLRDLLGYLREFFTQLGFPKVRFRPAYFPYTEPSLEVEVWFEPKKAWLELGGAGIFRQEVVEPLTGTSYPVLAWGLGLERLVMLLYGLRDVREIYRSKLSWLRNRKVVL